MRHFESQLQLMEFQFVLALWSGDADRVTVLDRWIESRRKPTR